jgi:hypothetical protein
VDTSVPFKNQIAESLNNRIPNSEQKDSLVQLISEMKSPQNALKFTELCLDLESFDKRVDMKRLPIQVARDTLTALNCLNVLAIKGITEQQKLELNQNCTIGPFLSEEEVPEYYKAALIKVNIFLSKSIITTFSPLPTNISSTVWTPSQLILTNEPLQCYAAHSFVTRAVEHAKDILMPNEFALFTDKLLKITSISISEK